MALIFLATTVAAKVGRHTILAVLSANVTAVADKTASVGCVNTAHGQATRLPTESAMSIS